MKTMLRNDIKQLRNQYKDRFTNTIPLMDKHGRLIFEEDRLTNGKDSGLADHESQDEQLENTHHPEFNADATLDDPSEESDRD